MTENIIDFLKFSLSGHNQYKFLRKNRKNYCIFLPKRDLPIRDVKNNSHT